MTLERPWKQHKHLPDVHIDKCDNSVNEQPALFSSLLIIQESEANLLKVDSVCVENQDNFSCCAEIRSSMLLDLKCVTDYIFVTSLFRYLYIRLSPTLSPLGSNTLKLSFDAYSLKILLKKIPPAQRRFTDPMPLAATKTFCWLLSSIFKEQAQGKP